MEIIGKAMNALIDSVNEQTALNCPYPQFSPASTREELKKENADLRAALTKALDMLEVVIGKNKELKKQLHQLGKAFDEYGEYNKKERA